MKGLKKIIGKKSKFYVLSLMMMFVLGIGFNYAGNIEEDAVFIYRGNFGAGGYLGVSIVKIPKIEKKKLGVKFGVKVVKVEKDSAAYKGNIQEGDVIQYFNGEKIRTPNSLIDAVRKTKPESKIAIRLVRKRSKKRVTVKVKIGDYSKRFSPKWFKKNKRAFLGVQLENMSDEFGSYFGVKKGEGALIRRVEEDTPAEEAEFRAGDVIIKFGKNVIKNSKDVSNALKNYKKGDKVKVVFLRHKKKMTAIVELDERSFFGNFNFKFNFDKIKRLKELKELESLKKLKSLKLSLKGGVTGGFIDEDVNVRYILMNRAKKIEMEKKALEESKRRLKKKVKETEI